MLVAACCVAALVASSLASGSGAPRQAKIGDGQGGIVKRKIGSFSSPTYVAHAPGAPSFLYVVEQRGTVAVVDRGHVRAQPFLDIRDRVSAGGERGLLSIAFDPAYARNHLLYAYYTNGEGNIEIDELRASSNTAAPESTRRRVIVIQHPGASNHNGGQIEFGPGGELFAGTGDGGAAGDPHEHAQNKQSLLGKLLRINPHRHGTEPYAIPSSNPYVGKPGPGRDLRARAAEPIPVLFRRQQDRDRRCRPGPLGGSRHGGPRRTPRSELRLGSLRGGSPLRLPGRQRGSPAQHNYRRPILDYPHNPGRCAIIGGYVVRNAALSSLRGRYLYSDNCDGVLRSFVPQDGKASERQGARRPRHQPELVRRGPQRVYLRGLAQRPGLQARPQVVPALRPPEPGRVPAGWRAQPQSERTANGASGSQTPADVAELRGPPSHRRLGDRDRPRSIRRIGSPRWSDGFARRSASGRRSGSRAGAGGSRAFATGSLITKSTWTT